MADVDEELTLTPQLVWQVYRVPILLGLLSLLLVALSIAIFIKSHQQQVPIRFSSDEESGSSSGRFAASEETILVDVEGGVVQPGVYRLPQGSRIDDLLGFAGGFTNQADMEAVARSINRVAKLSDGAKIYIPIKTAVSGNNNVTSEDTAIVNINTASQAELEDIPGVGPVTAGKIISGRPYMRVDELVEKGIMGTALYDKVKTQLTL